MQLLQYISQSTGWTSTNLSKPSNNQTGWKIKIGSGGPMADLHKAFCKFHDRIALTAGQKSTLGSVRDILRERIYNYFHYNLRVKAPIFRIQGSYAIDTAVNPIDNEPNIEDGVYLQHLDKMDDRSWPAVATVHQWLANAAGCHATEIPMDNRACVRLRSTGRYRIDLYAYGECNGQYFLAAKGEARWLRSAPLAFSRWFESYVHQRGEQLRRLVRYLNAWADYQSMQHGRMAVDLIATVLAVHYLRIHKRDDMALAKTIEAISDAVRSDFFVLNPVIISEELTARLAAPHKERLKDALLAFSDTANGALAIEDGYKASKLWRKLFGDRFPSGFRGK
jgi:hypothetical protein